MKIHDTDGRAPLHHACDLSRKDNLLDFEIEVVVESAHYLVVRCPQAIFIKDAWLQTPLDILAELTEIHSSKLTVARSLTIAMLKASYSREISTEHQKTKSENLVKAIATASSNTSTED
jgi:hypothetical protein